MSTGGITSNSATTAAKWLILLGLLWSQFASAAHQLDHHAHDVEENCAVCLLLDSNATPVTIADPGCSDVAAVDWKDIDARSYHLAEVFPHYSARASP